MVVSYASEGVLRVLRARHVPFQRLQENLSHLVQQVLKRRFVRDEALHGVQCGRVSDWVSGMATPPYTSLNQGAIGAWVRQNLN